MATMRQKLFSIPISQRSATARRILSTNAGYKSIGSFHSENVEDLMRLSDVDYNIPDLPFKQEDNSKQFIECYSHLDRSEFSFVNHGAFGLALDVGLSRAHSWRLFMESQPLRYFDRYLLNHLAHSARCLVDFLTNEKKDKMRESIALISNVTSGMNAVIGGHARCNENNDKKVFYFDIGYGSNKKMCQTYHGENAIEIPFEQDFLPLLQSIPQNSISSRGENDSHPQSADVFLSAFDASVCKLINEGKDSKSSLTGSLLILDHITSNTAIHTPIKTLSKYAREEYDMVTVVDGAHSLLSLPLDISNILSDGNDGQEGIDIYLTNCHKWFSAPRGAAALFCSNTHIQETILRQPAVVSHGVNDGFMS
ncbi:hypothetical protein ACHAWC_001806, partial [Mediolabrus comicus]